MNTHLLFKGKYYSTADLLFDWFKVSSFANIKITNGFTCLAASKLVKRGQLQRYVGSGTNKKSNNLPCFIGDQQSIQWLHKQQMVSVFWSNDETRSEQVLSLFGPAQLCPFPISIRVPLHFLGSKNKRRKYLRMFARLNKFAKKYFFLHASSVCTFMHKLSQS